MWGKQRCRWGNCCRSKSGRRGEPSPKLHSSLYVGIIHPVFLTVSPDELITYGCVEYETVRHRSRSRRENTAATPRASPPPPPATATTTTPPPRPAIVVHRIVCRGRGVVRRPGHVGHRGVAAAREPALDGKSAGGRAGQLLRGIRAHAGIGGVVGWRSRSWEEGGGEGEEERGGGWDGERRWRGRRRRLPRGFTAVAVPHGDRDAPVPVRCRAGRPDARVGRSLPPRIVRGAAITRGDGGGERHGDDYDGGGGG